ncbi:MAG: HAMP domain-containing histidine kinase [Clostridium sp.]|jgi:signal transduction histidine kinase|nr:HAMP domain-containing histidine kinase [Clostridium sp.]
MAESSFKSTILKKLAIAGAIVCVPALFWAVAAFFNGLQWYVFYPVLLLNAAGLVYVFCLLRDDMVQPFHRIRKKAGALIAQCGGAYPGADDDDFTVVLDCMNQVKDYLQTAAEERHAYEENRKDIIAGISHDIGTPLASIMGCAEALLEGIPQTQEKRQLYLQTIYQKASELSELSKNFYMYSCLDMENLPLHFEDVSFEDFWNPLVEELRESFAKNDIGFEELTRGFYAKKPPLLSMDTIQLKRVFQNLTNNCIKYIQRRPDTAPLARLSAEYLPDERLRFTLESNGVPVSHEDCGRIFTPYFRTNGAKSSAVNGSGVGLMVCKQLVNLHKATICARQSALGGLAIEVTFPVVQPLSLYNNC